MIPAVIHQEVPLESSQGKPHQGPPLGKPLEDAPGGSPRGTPRVTTSEIPTGSPRRDRPRGYPKVPREGSPEGTSLGDPPGGSHKGIRQDPQALALSPQVQPLLFSPLVGEPNHEGATKAPRRRHEAAMDAQRRHIRIQKKGLTDGATVF